MRFHIIIQYTYQSRRCVFVICVYNESRLLRARCIDEKADSPNNHLHIIILFTYRLSQRAKCYSRRRSIHWFLCHYGIQNTPQEATNPLERYYATIMTNIDSSMEAENSEIFNYSIDLDGICIQTLTSIISK